MRKTRTEYKILALSIVFGLFIIVVDSALNALVFDRGSFWQLLLSVPRYENYNSAILLSCFLAFGVIVAHLIAARHRALEAFRAGNEWLSTTLQSIGDAVIAVDLDGMVTYINPAAEELTGHRTEQAMGQPAHRLFSHSTAGLPEPLRPLELLAAESNAGDPARQLLAIDKNGSSKFFEYCAAVIHDRNKAITGAVLVFRDVTTQQLAQRTVRREKETIQQYFDLIGAMVVALDRQGRAIRVNRRCCNVLGLPEAEIIGKDWVETFIPERLRVRIKTTFNLLMQGKGEAREYYENPVCTAGGEERLIAWHNTVLTGEDGTVLGTVSSGEDITERDATVRTLRENEQQLRALISSAGDIIFTKDQTFAYTLVNPSMEALLGLPASDILGRTEDDVFGIVGESRDLLHDVDRRALAGETVEEEITRPIKGKPVTLHMVRMPVREDDGTITGVCGIARNITQRKQSANALRESEARLKRQNAALARLDMRKILVQGDLRSALRRITETIVETLGVARAGIWTFDRQETKIQCLDLYESGAERHSCGMELPRKQYPAYFAALEENTTIVAHNAHTDPHTREFSDSYLAPLGITSMIDAPIITGGRIAGVVCCEHIGPARRWALDEENFTVSMANAAGLALEIAERRHKEEQLRESEGRFQGIVLSTTDWVWEIDKNGTYTFASGRIKDILGYDPEEIIGKRPFQFMPPQEAERVGRIFQEILAEKKPIVDLENWNLTKKGKEVCLLTNGVPIFDEDGHFAGYRGIDKDITERKRIEIKLKESEERYRNLIERAHDGIAVIQNSHLVFINPRLAEMSGYTVEEMIGTPFANYITPDELEKVNEIHTRRMAGEEVPTIYQTAIRHRDGRKIEIEINIALITFNGAAASFVLIREITDRLHMKKATADILDAIQNDVYIVDRQYRLLYANAALVSQFGPPQGKTCHEYLDNREQPCPWCRMAEAAGGTIGRWRWHSATTNKTYDAALTPLAGPDNTTVFLGTFHDVGARELSRRATAQAQKILDQIFQESLDILMIVGEDGNVLRVSRVINDVLGYPPDTIVGSPVARLFKTQATSSHEELLARLRVYGGVFDGMELLRADGSVCLMDITATIIPWEDTRAVLATFREVTARALAENRHRENEAQYRTIIENTFDLIISYTPDGFIRYASPQVARYGYTPDDVIGRNLLEFIHPDDHERITNNLRHAVETGGEFLTECRLVGNDGTIYYVEEINKNVREGDTVVQITGVVRDITDRKYAEQIINARDELIKNTIESLAHPFYVVNADDYSIALANSATGFNISSERSTCHALMYDLSAPCEAPHCPCPLAIVKKTKQPARVEHVYTDAGEKRRVSEVHGYPILDAQGNVRQMIEYALDITDRKQAEEGLRNSEEKYRTLYSSMNEGMALHELICDENGTPLDYLLIDVNPAYEQILGLEQRAVIGRRATEVYQTAEAPFLKVYAQVVESGDPVHFEQYIESMNRTFRISAFSTGHARFATIFEDITPHKQYEDQIRMLGRFTQENPNPVLRVDKHGIINYANEQSGGLLRGWQTTVGQPVPEEWRRRMDETLQTGQQQDFEFKCGDTIYLMFMKPVTDAGYVNLYALDITDHRRTEMALQQSEQQLRQAQKMEAIGRVAGGVAHDFNNLISVISGHAELLTLRLQADDPLVHHAREIRETAEQAASLTRQLLAFSRKQAVESQVLNMNTVIIGINKMLRRLIGEKIELVTVAGPGLGTIKADPGQLEQVLMNLVINARDAMPEGGRITVETSNVNLEGAGARGLGLTAGPYVRLSVADTGTGMDEQTKNHIFEPFFTTKEAGKGTGLGLATVYGIITNNGGKIAVDSTLNHGTTFAIYLPRYEAPAADGRSPSRDNGVIMVVEDENEVREMVCKILEAQGHGVVAARNGDDALEKYRSAGNAISVLLTDIVMPHMSGIDLAERLVRQRPDLKVVFMSGYARSTAVRESPLGKTSPFLEKPFAPEHLRQTIKAALA
jgi:PAS domain S-box-containing protein